MQFITISNNSQGEMNNEYGMIVCTLGPVSGGGNSLNKGVCVCVNCVLIHCRES